MSVRFLIAGVQKGGTTALDAYLRRHAGVAMASIKEAHFFDDEAVDWDAPDYGRYHALFEGRGGVWGEATPIYVYWPNSLERIAAYDPAMKLIVLFRDPIERAWSQWTMETDRGWESEPFGWCIREGRRRVAEDPATPGFHRVFSYVERGFYGAQLERSLRLFPREQLLLLRAEDLRANPDATLARVTNFIGLERIGPVEPLEANVGRPAPLAPEDVAHLRSVFQDDMQRFAELSGIDPEAWPTYGARRPISGLSGRTE